MWKFLEIFKTIQMLTISVGMGTIGLLSLQSQTFPLSRANNYPIILWLSTCQEKMHDSKMGGQLVQLEEEEQKKKKKIGMLLSEESQNKAGV